MYAPDQISYRQPRHASHRVTDRLTDCSEPDRTKRVKEARDEAKKEIEAYKAKKEEEYKKFEAEVRWRPITPSLIPSPSLSFTNACH